VLGLLLAIAVVVVAAFTIPAARRRRTAVLYLARAIEGEGAGLFENREQVGAWVAHTALNRVESSWWPNTVEAVVVSGFYGHVRVSEPEDWARDLAREALEREEDQAQGAVFMLSGDDLKTRGWGAEGAIRCFEQGKYALCFFLEWPGEEQDD
jgi:hypothetical protein